MRIKLKTFHLRLGGRMYHPGDEAVITTEQFNQLLKNREGAFEVLDAVKPAAKPVEPEHIEPKHNEPEADKVAEEDAEAPMSELPDVDLTKTVRKKRAKE